MQHVLTKFSEAVGGVVRFLALVGGIVLMCLMGLTVVAVTLRKANSPILGAQDMSEAGLILVVFMAMAYSGWTGGHIAVDLIGSALRKRTLELLDVGVRSVSGLFFIVVTWMSAVHAMDAFEYGEGFNLLAIPHWPFYAMIAFGSALFALVLFVLALRSACGMPEIKAK